MVITALPVLAAVPTWNEEGNKAQMKPGEHASGEPGGTDGSAGQSAVQTAVALVAPVPSAPDSDAGRAGQQTGAVWDQPLPWATPGGGGENQSTARPMFEQAGSHAAPASRPPHAAAVRDEGGNDATADTKAAAEAAGNGSSVELWQAAVSKQRRGAHAMPAPSRVAAIGSSAVSKWLLGVAVAAGGLLAAVGVAEGLGSPRPSASAKEKPEPILGPDKGLDEADTPALPPPPPPPPTTPPKSRTAVQAGKVAVAADNVAADAVGAAVGPPKRAHTPGTAVTPLIASQQKTFKSSADAPSDYLSARTSVTSPNEYWSQSTVTVTTTEKLTALKVVVHIAQTGGVASTGTWTSFGDKVTVHSGRASDGGADYVVILNPGVTVEPGTYVFQFQYNHDKGNRDTVHDLYNVVATASDADSSESRQGRF